MLGMMIAAPKIISRFNSGKKLLSQMAGTGLGIDGNKMLDCFS
jgi:hypothetical protein